MVTKIIGLKEFRLNLSSYTKQVASKKMNIIVLNKNKPVMEIRPVDEDELLVEKFAKEIAEAREQVKRGEVYTLEEVKKMLGL